MGEGTGERGGRRERGRSRWKGGAGLGEGERRGRWTRGQERPAGGLNVRQNIALPLTNRTTSRLSPDLITDMNVAIYKVEAGEEAKISDFLTYSPALPLVCWSSTACWLGCNAPQSPEG